MLQFSVTQITDLPMVSEKLLPYLATCPVLLINGPMGAGKTTLVKEICKNLGVADEVSSPTYSLINEYHCQSGGKVFHFDFYRLRSMEEAEDIGAEDYFFSGSICLIEWPDLVRPLLPDRYLELDISVKDGTRFYNLRQGGG